MAVRATAKYLRLSPQKGRLAAGLVCGRNVEEAVNVLRFSPNKAAGMLLKVINSAVANAGQDPSVNVDMLYIRNIMVDGGPTLKRFQTRAMGRANRILKRTCHMTVILDQRVS